MMIDPEAPEEELSPFYTRQSVQMPEDSVRNP